EAVRPPVHGLTRGVALMAAQAIEADLTWTGASFEPGIRIIVDPDGRIAAVGATGATGAVGAAGTPRATGAAGTHRASDAVGAPGAGGASGAPYGTQTLRLANQAILPGFIDVHSHAFQRGLRGRGETFPPGAPDTPGNFWSWREAMYRLVDTMTADRIHELSRQAFLEMRAAGITTVGEFHYLHHDASGAS